MGFQKIFAGKNSFSIFIIQKSGVKYKGSLSGVLQKKVDLFWSLFPVFQEKYAALL